MRRTLAAALLAALIAAGCSEPSEEVARVVSGNRTADPNLIELFVSVCRAVPSVGIVENDDKVVVTVTYMRLEGDDECGRIVEVRLEEPLGEREVTDGPTGAVVPIGPVTVVVG